MIHSILCAPLNNQLEAFHLADDPTKQSIFIKCVESGSIYILQALMQLGGISATTYSLAIDAAIQAKHWDIVVHLVQKMESLQRMACRSKALKGIYHNCETDDRFNYLSALLNCEERERIHLFLSAVYDADIDEKQPNLDILEIMFMVPDALNFSETALSVYLFLDRNTRIPAIETRTVQNIRSFMISVGLTRSLNRDLINYLLSRIEIQADDYIAFKMAVEWGNVEVVNALLDSGEIPRTIVGNSSQYSQSVIIDIILENYLDITRYIRPYYGAKAA